MQAITADNNGWQHTARVAKEMMQSYVDRLDQASAAVNAETKEESQIAEKIAAQRAAREVLKADIDRINAVVKDLHDREGKDCG